MLYYISIFPVLYITCLSAYVSDGYLFTLYTCLLCIIHFVYVFTSPILVN